MSRILRYFLRLLLLAVIAAEAGYLARRPLLERPLLDLVQVELGAALGGEVQIAELGGNWVDRIVVRGLEIDAPGLTVRGGAVAVTLALGDLLGADPLAAVRRVDATAAECAVDLTAGAGAADAPAGDAAPFDPAALAGLARDGVRVAVDRLVLAGEYGRWVGPLALVAPPRRPSAPLAAELTGAGTRVAVGLGADGVLAVRASVAEPGLWLRPFAAAVVRGGHCGLELDGRVAGGVELTARVALHGVRIDGRRLDRVDLAARVGRGTVRDAIAWVDADGVELRARAPVVDLDDPLGRSRAELALRIGDLAPFRALLPDEAGPWLPVTGTAQLRVEDGWLVSDGVALRARGVELEVERGRWPFAADGDGELGVAGRVTDATRLAGVAELPVRVDEVTFAGVLAGVGGETRATVAVRATGSSADLGPLAVAGNVGVGVRPGGAIAGDVDLRVEGALADGVGAANVAGAAVLERGVLTVPRLELTAFGAGGAATTGTALARGRADLAAGDVLGLLRGAAAELELEDVGLRPLRRWLGPELDGALDGRVAWGGDGERLELELRGTVAGLEGVGSLTAELVASSAAGAVAIDRLHCAAAAFGLDARGRIDGVRLADAIEAPERLLAAGLGGTVELEARDLSVLPLVGAELRGGGAVRAELGGTLREPSAAGSAELREVSAAAAGRPLLAAASGRLRFDGRGPGRAGVVVDGLDFEVGARQFALAGTLGYEEGAVVAEGVSLRGAAGGIATIDGRLALDAGATVADALLADASLDVRVDDLPLAPWSSLAGIGLGGEAAARLRWRTDGGARCDGSATLTALSAPGLREPIGAEIRFAADRDGVRCERVVVRCVEGGVAGSLGLPGAELAALVSAAPGDLAALALTGELTIEGLALRALDPAALGLAELAGVVDGRIVAGGTLGAPDPRIELRLRGGHCQGSGLQRLEHVEAALVATADRVQLDSLSLQLGASPLTASGELSAPGPLLQRWREARLDLRALGRNVLLQRGTGLRLRGNLDVTARGPLSALEVGGRVDLVNSKFVGRVPLFALGPAGGDPVRAGLVLHGPDLGPDVHVRLDLAVATAEPLQVETNVFRGDLDAALQVTGTLQEPNLGGTVSSTRGTLVLPGTRFAVSSLLFEFERENWRFPELTMQATGRRHGFDLRMVVQGPYNAPEVTLSSSPPLAGEDLAVLVTTGALPRTLRERGAVGAATLVGTYVVEEIADYLFGSESTEAKESFISRLTVESGREISSDGTESIVIEYRMLERIYLQAERDVFDDINLGVVYRIRFK